MRLAAHDVDRLVVHHGEDPGGRAGAPGVEPAGLLPDGEKGFLHCVFGEGGVLKDAPRERVRGATVAVVQGPERVAVARAQSATRPLSETWSRAMGEARSRSRTRLHDACSQRTGRPVRPRRRGRFGSPAIELGSAAHRPPIRSADRVVSSGQAGLVAGDTSCTPGVPASSSLSQSVVAALVRPSGRRGAERGLSLNRFFKSALFPIVIVVLLAWLAQKYVLPGSSTKTTNNG